MILLYKNVVRHWCPTPIMQSFLTMLHSAAGHLSGGIYKRNRRWVLGKWHVSMIYTFMLLRSHVELISELRIHLKFRIINEPQSWIHYSRICHANDFVWIINLLEFPFRVIIAPVWVLAFVPFHFEGWVALWFTTINNS